MCELTGMPLAGDLGSESPRPSSCLAFAAAGFGPGPGPPEDFEVFFFKKGMYGFIGRVGSGRVLQQPLAGNQAKNELKLCRSKEEEEEIIGKRS
jgi:hypothetical protein